MNFYDACATLSAFTAYAIINNLKKILVSKGIDQDRLLFTNRMMHSEHLARLKLADLFLDTYPCNAHTTASDSLRSCLPIITLRGNSFASRVTSSLLSSVGLDKLITDTKEEYEEYVEDIIYNYCLNRFGIDRKDSIKMFYVLVEELKGT